MDMCTWDKILWQGDIFRCDFLEISRRFTCYVWLYFSRKLNEITGEDQEKTWDARFPTVRISLCTCDKKSTKNCRWIPLGCGACKVPYCLYERYAKGTWVIKIGRLQVDVISSLPYVVVGLDIDRPWCLNSAYAFFIYTFFTFSVINFYLRNLTTLTSLCVFRPKFCHHLSPVKKWSAWGATCSYKVGYESNATLYCTFSLIL